MGGEGRAWRNIGVVAVDAWCADFANHRPGGGEPVAALLERCAAFVAQPREAQPLCVVGHAGWISAALWLQQSPGGAPAAAAWPAALPYGRSVVLLGAAARPAP